MFDSVADLLEQISLGEDTFLEFKEVRFAGDKVSAPERRDLADELAAFANRRGGVCLLGVSDQREVLGVPVCRDLSSLSGMEWAALRLFGRHARGNKRRPLVMMSCLKTTRPGVSVLDSIYHRRRSQRLSQ